jgi:Ras-related protein Rab-21
VKVVLLGEGAVGKTSIVLRYVENKFNDKHVQTLQVGSFAIKCTTWLCLFQASFVQKNLNINNRRITLNIWVNC